MMWIMIEPGEIGAVQVGFPDADRLLGEAGTLRERIVAQASSLASLSRAALAEIKSPAAGSSLEKLWPLTDAAGIEEFLLANALANIGSGKDSEADDEQPAGLDGLLVGESALYDGHMEGVYVDYGRGYPPTGFSQDLIKWSDELARRDWSILAIMDKALAGWDHRFNVSVYPATAVTRELIDEKTRVAEEYTASKWLSGRVLLHAYSDEFDRFDWIGSGSGTEQSTH